jgi:hypothetical protein
MNDATEERSKRRALMAFEILQRIVERAGTGSVEHVHIAALTAIADTRGLWRFLLDRGFATEAQHQDYLDRGYQELREQVESHASKIYVAEGGRG